MKIIKPKGIKDVKIRKVNLSLLVNFIVNFFSKKAKRIKKGKSKIICFAIKVIGKIK